MIPTIKASDNIIKNKCINCNQEYIVKKKVLSASSLYCLECFKKIIMEKLNKGEIKHI